MIFLRYYPNEFVNKRRKCVSKTPKYLNYLAFPSHMAAKASCNPFSGYLWIGRLMPSFVAFYVCSFILCKPVFKILSWCQTKKDMAEQALDNSC